MPSSRSVGAEILQRVEAIERRHQDGPPLSGDKVLALYVCTCPYMNVSTVHVYVCVCVYVYVYVYVYVIVEELPHRDGCVAYASSRRLTAYVPAHTDVTGV